MPLTLSVNITGFNLEVTDIVWLNNNGTVVSQTSDIYTITNSSLDAPVGTATLFVESITSPVVYGGIYRVTISIITLLDQTHQFSTCLSLDIVSPSS